MNILSINRRALVAPLASGIFVRLFTQGWGKTLEYFCTISVFSMLSEA